MTAPKSGQSPSPEHGFRAPPIWELAVSAVTHPGAIDQYDVRGVHEKFKSELPRVARHAPVQQSAIANLLGVHSTFIESARPGPRWWFVGDDPTDVLQLQDQFVAQN